MISVYVGGPIDRADETEADAWRQRLQDLMRASPQKYLAFDPRSSFCIANFGEDLEQCDCEAITRTNRTFLGLADYALFYLGGASPAFGTIREIEYAKARKVPVVVVAFDLTRVVEAHDLVVVRSLQAALDVIEYWESEDGTERPETSAGDVMKAARANAPPPLPAVEVAPPPPQEHAQPPTTDWGTTPQSGFSTSDHDYLTKILAGLLMRPENCHNINGKHRHIISVPTDVIGRTSHLLDNGNLTIVGGKYDDGWCFLEAIPIEAKAEMKEHYYLGAMEVSPNKEDLDPALGPATAIDIKDAE